MIPDGSNYLPTSWGINLNDHPVVSVSLFDGESNRKGRLQNSEIKFKDQILMEWSVPKLPINKTKLIHLFNYWPTTKKDGKDGISLNHGVHAFSNTRTWIKTFFGEGLKIF